jgi:hypothetical protein
MTKVVRVTNCTLVNVAKSGEVKVTELTFEPLLNKMCQTPKWSP